MNAEDFECPICGGTQLFHADYCERGWNDSEKVSLKRLVKVAFWIMAILFLMGAAFGLMSCTATPVHGPHDCRQYGYHKHMADTVGVPR